jgi:dihydrodipicolinate reductase
MPVRIGIAGIRGRMGREIAALAAGDPALILVGGISRRPGADESDGVRIVTPRCSPASTC